MLRHTVFTAPNNPASCWPESQETPSFLGVPRSVLAKLAEKQGLAATKAVQIAACAVFRKEFPNTVADTNQHNRR
jgi:hypothetical protein